jgi:hypothetical protein
MNWASIYSASNNAFSNLPPMMSDGRNFSNLLPDEVINDSIKRDAGITSNWDYRRYLQNNASHIIRQNSQSAIASTGLIENPLNNVPVDFFGQNHIFEPHSDLKTQYMSREQLNSRLIAPVINLDNSK